LVTFWLQVGDELETVHWVSPQGLQNHQGATPTPFGFYLFVALTFHLPSRFKDTASSFRHQLKV
jgi:hypothetical protein